jgi:hypothetical protein
MLEIIIKVQRYTTCILPELDWFAEIVGNGLSLFTSQSGQLVVGQHFVVVAVTNNVVDLVDVDVLHLHH